MGAFSRYGTYMYYKTIQDAIDKSFTTGVDNFRYTEESVALAFRDNLYSQQVPIDEVWTTPLDLRSDKEKLVFIPHPAIGHLLLDSIPLIFSWAMANPSHEIIIADPATDPVNFYVPEHHVGYQIDAISSMEKVISSMGVSVRVVSARDLMLINKFNVLSAHNNTVPPSYNLYSTMQTMADMILDETPSPDKKLYVSRCGTRSRPQEYPEDKANMITDDRRVFNEEHLEKLFLEMGFEIIDPEPFTSLKEQIKLFRSAKVVAGVTGAGLSNFMFTNSKSPNRLLFEIATPLVTPDAQDSTKASVSYHAQYSTLAKLTESEYLTVSALTNRDGEAVADRIRSSRLYSYLSNY